MRFRLTIDMDNAAFEDAPATETVRILRDVALSVEDGQDKGTVRDYNGNRVGTYAVTGRATTHRS